jgi:hypothetical protein
MQIHQAAPPIDLIHLALTVTLRQRSRPVETAAAVRPAARTCQSVLPSQAAPRTDRCSACTAVTRREQATRAARRGNDQAAQVAILISKLALGATRRRRVVSGNIHSATAYVVGRPAA